MFSCKIMKREAYQDMICFMILHGNIYFQTSRNQICPYVANLPAEIRIYFTINISKNMLLCMLAFFRNSMVSQNNVASAQWKDAPGSR